mmetsp:Transcript_110634/g.312986  ORF Transcript_110634/g.312986 Transcript_110634/m.312986 type:complete len:222 (+) Transcript_110634:228-893(+)
MMRTIDQKRVRIPPIAPVKIFSRSWKKARRPSLRMRTKRKNFRNRTKMSRDAGLSLFPVSKEARASGISMKEWTIRTSSNMFQRRSCPQKKNRTPRRILYNASVRKTSANATSRAIQAADSGWMSMLRPRVIAFTMMTDPMIPSTTGRKSTRICGSDPSCSFLLLLAFSTMPASCVSRACCRAVCRPSAGASGRALSLVLPVDSALAYSLLVEVNWAWWAA